MKGRKKRRGQPRPPQPDFKSGTCNTICARTGFKVKLDETSREWTGDYIRSDLAEPRQPQDFPVIPKAPKVYAEARSEDEENIRVYTPVEDVTKL